MWIVSCNVATLICIFSSIPLVWSDIKEITPALIQQKEFILYGDVFFLRYVAHNGDMTDYIVIKKSYVN